MSTLYERPVLLKECYGVLSAALRSCLISCDGNDDDGGGNDVGGGGDMILKVVVVMIIANMMTMSEIMLPLSYK